jgi:hypothetical protein
LPERREPSRLSPTLRETQPRFHGAFAGTRRAEPLLANALLPRLARGHLAPPSPPRRGFSFVRCGADHSLVRRHRARDPHAAGATPWRRTHTPLDRPVPGGVFFVEPERELLVPNARLFLWRGGGDEPSPAYEPPSKRGSPCAPTGSMTSVPQPFALVF